MTSEQDKASVVVALSIAGLDPSGGAGVIADVRTFAAFGCFATAAITSLTFQNTTGVFGALHQTAETVRAQVTAIIQDLQVNTAKTGMLPTREVITEVAQLFRGPELPAPVVDPVMRATSGDDLIDDGAVSTLISELFPLARIVTPNIPESERLTGLKICDEATMRVAAKTIREMGTRAVLVKGGHLCTRQEADARGQEADGRRQEADSDSQSSDLRKHEAIDVLDDGGRVTVFREELIAGGEVHGSGCTLSAAIAACLGQGMILEEAVGRAKQFVTEAIRRSPAIGHGARPLYLASSVNRKS